MLPFILYLVALLHLVCSITAGLQIRFWAGSAACSAYEACGVAFPSPSLALGLVYKISSP